MEFQGKAVHLSEVVTRRGDKTYRSFYLRHAYRDQGRIKKETLLKPSTLSRIVRCLLSKSRPPAAGFSGFR